ncbi:hypothetical protein [Azospirillum sp.]|uniref:hypothetical protein n=1 Tax=Azospirillum sp. TaxID=34012 RepID=UPI002604C3B3|nr:hypothetical protein [Azospirillum sp.]
MTNSSVIHSETSRRSVLRMLAGMPLLPVAGGVGVRRVRRHGRADDRRRQATTTVESSMVVSWTDGTKQSFALG